MGLPDASSADSHAGRLVLDASLQEPATAASPEAPASASRSSCARTLREGATSSSAMDEAETDATATAAMP